MAATIASVSCGTYRTKNYEYTAYNAKDLIASSRQLVRQAMNDLFPNNSVRYTDGDRRLHCRYVPEEDMLMGYEEFMSTNETKNRFVVFHASTLK